MKKTSQGKFDITTPYMIYSIPATSNNWLKMHHIPMKRKGVRTLNMFRMGRTGTGKLIDAKKKSLLKEFTRLMDY